VQPTPFEAALDSRYPAVGAVRGQRLRDITPYVLPRHDEVWWFLCRWPDDTPVRTAFPTDATPRERELLRMALDAWEKELQTLRFRVVPEPADADIVFEIGAIELDFTAKAGAECFARESDGRLEARLVHARVLLRRSMPDTRGREVDMADAEWLGAALHELGHALGFQGHERYGSGVMAREVERVLAHGEQVLAGEALHAPSLVALYRLPPGAVVARPALPKGRTAAIDRLAELAAEKGYHGPLVRVGDTAARIAWLDGKGGIVEMYLPDIRDALATPARLKILPDILAAAWLGPKLAPVATQPSREPAELRP
jgi:hypothetical protein